MFTLFKKLAFAPVGVLTKAMRPKVIRQGLREAHAVHPQRAGKPGARGRRGQRELQIQKKLSPRLWGEPKWHGGFPSIADKHSPAFIEMMGGNLLRSHLKFKQTGAEVARDAGSRET